MLEKKEYPVNTAKLLEIKYMIKDILNVIELEGN